MANAAEVIPFPGAESAPEERPVLVLDSALAAVIDAGDMPAALRQRRVIAPLRMTIEALVVSAMPGTVHPFDAWLRGMIAYVEMANAEQGRKLRADFEALYPG